MGWLNESGRDGRRGHIERSVNKMEYTQELVEMI